MGKKGKKVQSKQQTTNKKRDDSPPSRRNNRMKKKGSSNSSHDDSELRKAVEEDGRRTIIEMQADGNCLFRSLADQLYYDFGMAHAEVRHEICDLLEAFEDEFKAFLVLDENEDDEDGKDYEDYVATQREDGTWGGNLELVAAARLYRRNITVFSAELAAFTIEHGASKSAGPDMLLSFHDNEHYNSVRDNSLSRPPPPVKTFVKLLEEEDGEEETKQEEEGYFTAEEESPREASVADDQEEKETKSPTVNVRIKKNEACPCGSGLKYKKCCWAKAKHAARLDKLRGGKQSTSSDSDGEAEMDGHFRVLKI